MKKSLFEEIGGTYRKCGDYYIPNLIAPESKHNIGKYGMLHKEYIKEHHKGFYSRLVLSCQLNEYLFEVDTRARNMVEDIVSKSAVTQDITEELKAKDPMKWVGMMNNIKAQAEEFVYTNIVYN